MRCDAMRLTAEVWVRSEWMYQVRTACQEFQNRTFDSDRHGFAEAARWLRRHTPEAQTIQEAEWLKTMLKDGIVSSGIAFHRRYHRRLGRSQCGQSPVEASHHVWAQHHHDPRVTLEQWITQFRKDFDRTHPMTIAERAAAILRSRFCNPPGLDELARLLGTSRSMLVRAFKNELSVTPREYVERVRLERFISEARNSKVSLTTLAEQFGYRSYHNLVDGIRRRTGQLPRTVRTLSSDGYEQLRARVDQV